MSCIIGIDGGATRARAVVVDPEGRELARIQGEAARVTPDDPAGVASDLADLAARALAAAAAHVATAVPSGTPGAKRAAGSGAPAALCCALAGAGRKPERDAVEAALERRGIAGRVVVTTDAEAALEDAFSGGAGILLIAGTGSIAWGRAPDGRTARAGGWGEHFGDEGSGYAIAVEALRAIAYAHDGRGAATALVHPVLGHAAAADPEALIGWAAAASKAEIAALAPLVLAAAEAGDDVAEDMVARAAANLAAHVVALIPRLGPWPEPPRLVLAGGLLDSGRPLRRRVQDALGARRCEVRLVDRPVDAARGAATLVRKARTVERSRPGTSHAPG